jgi:hypothetical protein
VKLAVYNMLGQQVEVLVNEQRGAGFHSLRFNASNYSSGMYLYRLDFDGQMLVRKLLLLK